MLKLIQIVPLKFIEQTNNDAFSSGRLTPELAHILSYAFYSGLFEIVIHNMPQERASEHIGKLRKFYNTGWKTIFEGDEAEQVNGERGECFLTDTETWVDTDGWVYCPACGAKTRTKIHRGYRGAPMAVILPEVQPGKHCRY